MRLIDADALLKEIENEQKYLIARGQLSEEHILVHSLKRPVLDAPTVEPIKVGDVCKECWREGGNVIEVVRCKDCKHYVIHILFGHRQGWCERLCDKFDKSLARGTEEDDFCSKGERKNE